MNIYLIRRKDKIDYDEYDAVVSAGINAEEAQKNSNLRNYKNVTITFVGTAHKNLEAGEILGSFNAG